MTTIPLNQAELGTLLRVYDRREILGPLAVLERLCDKGLVQQVRRTKVIPNRGVVDVGPDWTITKAGVERCRPPSLSSRQMSVMECWLRHPRAVVFAESDEAKTIMRQLLRMFCVRRHPTKSNAFVATRRGLAAARLYEQDLRNGS